MKLIIRLLYFLWCFIILLSKSNGEMGKVDKIETFYQSNVENHDNFQTNKIEQSHITQTSESFIPKSVAKNIKPFIIPVKENDDQSLNSLLK